MKKLFKAMVLTEEEITTYDVASSGHVEGEDTAYITVLAALLRKDGGEAEFDSEQEAVEWIESLDGRFNDNIVILPVYRPEASTEA